MHLVWRFPAGNSHRNIVRTAQITLHLLLKVFKRIEAQIVVETLLIISMTSLYLSVMPWSPRTDKLMLDFSVIAKHIKWMNTLGIDEMSKFRTIISLNDFRNISKEDNGSFKATPHNHNKANR